MVAINEILAPAVGREETLRGRGELCVENPGGFTRDPIGVPDLIQAKNMISVRVPGVINFYGYVGEE